MKKFIIFLALFPCSVLATTIDRGKCYDTFYTGHYPDYTEFQVDGTMIANGNATTWDDIMIPLESTKQGTNAKPAFDETNIGYLFPDNDATAILYGTIQIPHSAKVGTVISPHLHWIQTSASSPTFKMDYSWYNIAKTTQTFTTVFLSSGVMQYTGGSMHQVSDIKITPSAAQGGISSIFDFKLYRVTNGTTGNVLGKSFDIHFEKDTTGSRTEYSK